MIHSKLYKIHSFYYTSMIILQFKEIRKWLMIIPHIIKIAQNIRLASRGFIIQNINKYGFHRIMTYNISWYEFANGLRLNIDYKGFIFSVDVKCESLLFEKPDFLNSFFLGVWYLNLKIMNDNFLCTPNQTYVIVNFFFFETVCKFLLCISNIFMACFDKIVLKLVVCMCSKETSNK